MAISKDRGRRLEASSIHTLEDAIWYSLVPVTPLGHAVGIVFLFLATGITVALLGALLSVLTGELMPLFLLGFQRGKNWCYFADYGVESNTLAGDICREDPDAVIIIRRRPGCAQ